MKADRTMSRMMKLRIALGNAILPNVPQATDSHFSMHVNHCIRKLARRRWLSEESHKRSFTESKGQSNMLNSKDRALKLEIPKKSVKKGTIFSSLNRIKPVWFMLTKIGPIGQSQWVRKHYQVMFKGSTSIMLKIPRE